MGESNTLLEKLEALVPRYDEVATLITDPAVVGDQQRYVRLAKEYKDLGEIMSLRKRYMACLSSLAEAKMLLLHEQDGDMRTLAREEIATQEPLCREIETAIREALVPKDPEDAKDVQMEIRAGTGGDEACLFAGDLFAMYKRYCDARGWQMAVSYANAGAVGGYKEIDCAIHGDGVYGVLKYESGVHRVQRVPLTEANGRIQTSAATVAVLPEAEAFEVTINEGAIKWDTFRSSGAGGQNVNKVETGVRARYLWTNPNTGVSEEILIECTETREQGKNKERALARLRTYIYDREHQHYVDDIAARRKTLVSTGDRSAKIRTYNFPQGRVTDHRIGYTSHDLQGILGGNLQALLDALTVAENATKMATNTL